MYDLIIIGGGPAGMTAAIYAARRKIKFLVLSLDIGGQMSWSSEVDNYPGLPDFTGLEVVKRFNEHIKDYKIKINTEEVMSINRKEKDFTVMTNKKIYESRSIIVASGKKPRKLGIPGEEEFLGKGVAYCATCDAPLFKNKNVAVIGAGNSGLESALFLSKYAKKVYILGNLPNLAGEKYLKDKVIASKKIAPILSAEIKEIHGKDFVEKIIYEKKGKPFKLSVGGVFVEIGLVAKTDFGGLLKKNQKGEIMIFRSTKTHEENLTNIPGIFAAGDVTDIPTKQIVIAAGEGAKAALACFNYLDRN